MVKIDMQDPSVVHGLEVLNNHGYDKELLLQCSDLDIDNLAPVLISPLDALRIKIALRKEREQIKEGLGDDEIYQSLLPMVGRVDAVFIDDVTKKNYGNCVLVANPGLAVTAMHIVTRTIIEEMEDNEKANIKGKTKLEDFNTKKRRRKKGPLKKVEKNIPIKYIEVCFPNTRAGVFQYRARIVASSSSTDDLALIGPIDSFGPHFADLKTLQRWVPYKPEINDKIILMSFPSCRGEVRFSNCPTQKDDLPWFAKGHVSCFDVAKGHGFASYSSFEGASGSLAVHPLPNGGYRAMIHLGTYHESEEIPIWHESALSLLNQSLLQKACNGYFTLNTGTFLESYFGAAPDHMSRYLHPQVASRELKGDIEVLDDIWSPWPGLDDNSDADDMGNAKEEDQWGYAIKRDEAFGLILSWDNVLADTKALRFEAWKQLALEEGKRLKDDSETERHILSMGTEKVLRKVLGWVDADNSVERFKARLAKIHCENLSKVMVPREGLKEGLEALATAGVPCAVASSLDHFNLFAALQSMGIHKYLQAFVTQEDRMESMAHRFLAAAVKLECDPSKCVVVEVDPCGIVAAHSYGMKAVAMIGPHSASELIQADLVVSSFSELSVTNLQGLFAIKGVEFMDQLAEKKTPKRKR